MNIDKQLLEVLQASAWTKIPYESLLETNPQQIRIEESNLIKRIPRGSASGFIGKDYIC